MKKSKIIAITIALTVCLVLLFTGCTLSGNKVFTADTFKPIYDSFVYSNYYNLGLEGYSYSNSVDELVLLNKVEDGYTTYKVVNMKKKTTVGTFYNDVNTTYSVNLRKTYINGESVAFYTVTRTNSGNSYYDYRYDYYLYGSDGNQGASYSSNESGFTFDYIEDIVSVNGSFYVINSDGSINSSFSAGGLNQELPDISGKVGGYYYEIDENEKKIVLYNNLLHMTFFHTLPSYAQDVTIVPLNNGNIYIQYVVEKFDTDNKYDIIMDLGNGMKKYSLYQQYINAAKSKVKNAKNKKYYVHGGYNRTEDFEIRFNGIQSKIENIVFCYPIKDKYVNTSAGSSVVAQMNNKGKVKKVLNNTFNGEMDFIVVASNRVMMLDVNDRAYLYDFNGSSYGEVTNSKGATNKYIVDEKQIFDYNLSSVYDIYSHGLSYAGTMGDGILLRNKNGGYRLFNDGYTTTLCDDEGYFSKLNGNMYVTRTESYSYSSSSSTMTYKLNNSKGNTIMTSDYSFSNVASFEDVALVKTNSTYYIIY